jgi:hypothetical protein
VRAYLADVHFVFFAYGDWAVSSVAFVFGVSWASLFRTDRTFSPLFYALTVISSVSRGLSITHKIRLRGSTRLSRCQKTETYWWLDGCEFDAFSCELEIVFVVFLVSSFLEYSFQNCSAMPHFQFLFAEPLAVLDRHLNY